MYLIKLYDNWDESRIQAEFHSLKKALKFALEYDPSHQTLFRPINHKGKIEKFTKKKLFKLEFKELVVCRIYDTDNTMIEASITYIEDK